jgi:SmpA / OmlA family
MSSRRRTLLIALAVAILGSATLASWHLYSTVPEKLTRISVGMTRQEVAAILGPPTATWVFSVQTADQRGESWDSGRWSLLVMFKSETAYRCELIKRDDPLLVWWRQIRKRLGL